jgi:hypothetical protein
MRNFGMKGFYQRMAKKKKRKTCECGEELPYHLLEAHLEVLDERPGSGGKYEHVCSCGARYVVKDRDFARDGVRQPLYPIDST